MRQTTKARHTLGIRGQLMWFLCFICLFLLGLFWLLSTQLLEPLYTKHIETQLTNQADSIVERLDDAIAEGKVLSSWSFGQLAVNSDFFDKLTLELYTKGSLNSFCVDISDTTLHTIYKIENQSFCNLHGTYLSDSANNDKIIATALAMRRKCRSVGSFVQTLNPPRLSGSAQLLVGRITADGSYTVLVTTSLVHVTEAGKVLSTLLPLAAALIFGFAMSAAWLFSEWFTKPLRQLSSAARQMALGNYAVQVDNRRNDELGDLARDFNHMAEEVQHAVQMQRDLLANVSHDLRTPLTLIKGYAETVRDLTGDDDAKRTEQCNIIVDETDRLSTLVNSVMELSKVQSGAEKPSLVDFDMSELCFEVAGRYDALCDKNHWHLDLQADDACPVSADPAMMERVLHNLLGNAFHHIGSDGVVVLRAIPQQRGCRIEVEDHGPGIPPEDLPYLFDRYYRARQDSGRSGTGLGLSITKAILQQHGFAFGVNSAVGQGSTFWFEMADTRA